MQYTIKINQPKATEWGLNLQQATLFDFLYELPSWADCHILNGLDYHWITYSKIISEMPILSQHKDTIYRYMKFLSDKGLIEIQQQGLNIFVRTTRKGKVWNRDAAEKQALGKKSEGSEKNPSSLGKKSEPPPEKNPTYHNTTYPLTKSKNHHPLPPLAHNQEKEEVEEYIRLETDRAEATGEIRTNRANYAAGVRRKITAEGEELTPVRREQLAQLRSPPTAFRTIPVIDPDVPRSEVIGEAKIQDHEIRARALARLPPWEQEIVRTREYLKETCGE